MAMMATASKREGKRDERRETILDVARDCFLVYGYAATSMSAIAARLGGSKGTLYNYFKSKDELFGAMMQRQCGELQETLFDVAHVNGDHRARLKHYGRSFLELLLSPDAVAIHRLVVAESDRFPELGRAFYESGPRLAMERIGAYLGELMDRGVLRRADTLIAATHFKDLAMSGIYNLRLWGITTDLSPERIDEQIDCAVDTFMRAYAP
jgi:TetR/AcrR family transcriptional repressor of mexJK operon